MQTALGLEGGEQLLHAGDFSLKQLLDCSLLAGASAPKSIQVGLVVLGMLATLCA